MSVTLLVLQNSTDNVYIEGGVATDVDLSCIQDGIKLLSQIIYVIVKVIGDALVEQDEWVYNTGCFTASKIVNQCDESFVYVNTTKPDLLKAQNCCAYQPDLSVDYIIQENNVIIESEDGQLFIPES